MKIARTLLVAARQLQYILRGPCVVFLRSFIHKLETSGAVAPSESDDPEPMTSALAAADAAIQEAIRRRSAGGLVPLMERRDPMVLDRRETVEPAIPAERRGPIADRRSKGRDFGRRTRG